MKIFKVVAELLYPNRCVFCEELCKESVCVKCKQEVIYITEPNCKKCGKPIRYAEREYCHDCESRKKSFDVGRSLWLHKTVVAQSLYRFKYHKRMVNAKFYAKELVRKYAKLVYEWEIDEIIPVPVHKKRLAQRGFNQAELVAEYISDYLKIPMNAKAIVRTTNTKAQKHLGFKGRRWNLRGAFRVVKGTKIAKRVLIIDDIYTTGSTLEELAFTLKKAGARKVCFLTISIGQGM